MSYFAIKTLLSALIIALISEIARRSPGFADENDLLLIDNNPLGNANFLSLERLGVVDRTDTMQFRVLA